MTPEQQQRELEAIAAALADLQRRVAALLAPAPPTRAERPKLIATDLERAAVKKELIARGVLPRPRR